MAIVKPLSRRTFLIGAGLAIPLPFLEAMLPFNRSWAAEPMRFGTFYKSWGLVLDNGVWGSALLNIMKPYQNYSTIVTGLKNPGYGYENSTGMDNHLEHRSFMSGEKNYLKTTSIDRILALKLNVAGMMFPTGLNIGTKNPNAISFMNGVDSTYYSDPKVLLDLIVRLGGGVASSSSSSTAPVTNGSALSRKSILDRSKDSINSLRPKLSNHDKAVLDQHLTSIEQLERTLTPTTPTSPSASCSSPAVGANLGQKAKMEALIDLAAVAINCDLTRTLTFEFSPGGGGNNSGQNEYLHMTPAGVETSYHGWTHDRVAGCTTGAGGADCSHDSKLTENLMRQADQYELGLFARFLSQTNRAAIMDNAAFIFGGGGGAGQHGADNIPFCLVGKVNGTVRPQGQAMLARNGIFSNDMWVEIMKKLGANVTQLGSYKGTSTTLPG